MKTVVGGFLAALVLFAAAAISWSQAGMTDRVADAHRRLATLRLDDRAALDGPGDDWATSRWDINTLSGDIQQYRTRVTYWLSRYQALTPLLDATGQLAVQDSAVLFAAANASFRSSNPEGADHKAAVERLDHVMQAYAQVLRLDPGHADASYNYEYVARIRDMVAKGKKIPHPAVNPTDAIKADLPPGSTIHGTPGFPPPDIDMGEFKTLTPMKYEEREEQTDPGRGAFIKRRG